MSQDETEAQERTVAHETLIRLANSCDRAATRGNDVTPTAVDLNDDDFRTIADILRQMAKTIA